MIFTIIETIRINLKSDIIERIEEENKIEKENFKYKYECKKLPDQTYWICRLFSDFKLPIDANLANLRDKLKKGFRKPDGSSDADSTAKDILGKWNSTRFSKFMDTIGQTEKTALITSINEIDTVKIETVDDIPILLKEQFENLSPPKKTPKKNEVDTQNIGTSELEQMVDNEPDESTPVEHPPSSLIKQFSSYALITIIFVLVLFVIFVIIFFIAKKTPDPHDDITTTSKSAAITVSTEMSTISLTSTTASNDRTTTASSEAAIISTFSTSISEEVVNTVTILSSLPNVETKIIIVTEYVKSTYIEVATEPPPPPPTTTTITTTTTHIPITTYNQVPSNSRCPDIKISSVNAYKGQSDVCIDVVFFKLTSQVNYYGINMNFNIGYDRDLIFKDYSILPDTSEIRSFTTSDDCVSINMNGDYCTDEITVRLLFDIPYDAADGDYVLYMLEDDTCVTLLNVSDIPFNTKKYNSLYRYGVIRVS